MAKTLKLTLKKDLIFEAVKADTYQSGQSIKSDDPVANAAKAYIVQAGDEIFHMRKLLRHLRSGLAKFAAQMSEFVDTEDGGIRYTLSDDDAENNIIMEVDVSERYNQGLAQPISSFAEDYVVNVMDHEWWKPINSEKAQSYLLWSKDVLTDIRLCLAKTAPKASESSYTDVTGEVVERNSNDNTDPADPVDPSEPSDSEPSEPTNP